MAYQALVGAMPIQLANVQLSDANGNGGLDPDECADIVVTLRNVSGQTMSGLSAVLTSPVRRSPLTVRRTASLTFLPEKRRRHHTFPHQHFTAAGLWHQCAFCFAGHC